MDNTVFMYQDDQSRKHKKTKIDPVNVSENVADSTELVRDKTQRDFLLGILCLVYLFLLERICITCKFYCCIPGYWASLLQNIVSKNQSHAQMMAMEVIKAYH